MKTFSAIVVLVGLVHLSEQLKPNPNFKSITLAEGEVAEGIPVNPFADICGGTAKLISQRNTLCDPVKKPECKGPLGTEDATMETYFTPTKDVANIGWRSIVTFEGKEPLLDYEGELGPVVANKNYKLQVVVTPSPEIPKGKLSAKYEFFDVADNSVQLCIAARFEFL